MTKIRCRIRENAKYLEGKRDLTATQEAGFIKILARWMPDCLAVCREFGKSYVVAVNANQPASVQWCLLSKQTIKAFKKSTGWQESALGSSIPLVVQAFYVYCKSYEEII